MITLYRRSAGQTFYWQAWHEDERIVVLTGVVGQRGDEQSIPLPPGEDPDAAVEAKAERPREDGYVEMPEDAFLEVVVQYAVDPHGPARGLTERGRVEDLLDAALGWTGNGWCDGGEVVPAGLNVYCLALDVPAAVRTIVAELQRNELAEGAIVAAEQGDRYRVLWPAGHRGDFRL